jgi:hypothetical protein
MSCLPFLLKSMSSSERRPKIICSTWRKYELLKNFFKKMSYSSASFCKSSFAFIPILKTFLEPSVILPFFFKGGIISKNNKKSKQILQVNLFEKPSFLLQLTHNISRGCSLNSPKNKSSEHVVYKNCIFQGIQ